MKKKFAVIVTLISIVAGIFNIQINKAKLRAVEPSQKKIVLNKGEKAKIRLKGKVKWKSGNRKIATVSAKGIVRARRQGKTKIIARKGKIKKIYHIKVVNKKTKDKEILENNVQTVPTSANGADVKYTQKPAVTPLVPQQTKEPAVPDDPEKPTANPPQATEKPSTNPPQDTDDPQPEPPVSFDVWLLFGIDQAVLTPQTTFITGSVSFEEYESIINVIVGDKCIASRKLVKGDVNFSMEVDFSACKKGDEVIISREYVGDRDPSVSIWDQVKQYIIS